MDVMTRRHDRLLGLAGLMLAVGLGGCASTESDGGTSEPGSPSAGSPQTPTPSTPTPSDTPAAPPSATPQQDEDAPGTTITSGGSAYGPMLYDAAGQAIYIWEREDSDRPRCYDACAAAWPPVLTDGDPRADGRVSAKKLGTTRRSDGTTQVTYNGHPLYYYADEQPGEVLCHNVATHGGLWWVIQPDGDRAP